MPQYRTRPKPRYALPTPGSQWICTLCEEPCRVTYQDVSPDERWLWEYRSDCCSHYFEEHDIEADKEEEVEKCTTSPQ